VGACAKVVATTEFWNSNLATPNWIARALSLAAAPIENRARVVRMSIGPGTGGSCAYCHKRIEPESVDYAVDAYVATRLRSLHFHRICLHLWEAMLSHSPAEASPAGAADPGTSPETRQ